MRGIRKIPYTAPDPDQGLVLYKVFYSSSFWDLVINKVSRRLDGWKKFFLFLRRRITLIQYFLSHILSYFLPLFQDSNINSFKD